MVCIKPQLSLIWGLRRQAAMEEVEKGGLGGVQRREGKNKGIIPSSFTFGLNNEALRVSE